MSGRFQIGGYWYRTRVVHGRQFLNGKEHGVIVHHDTKIIAVSDRLKLSDAIELTAEAVAGIWCESAGRKHGMPKPGKIPADFNLKVGKLEPVHDQ